jgi:hypothetical protein
MKLDIVKVEQAVVEVDISEELAKADEIAAEAAAIEVVDESGLSAAGQCLQQIKIVKGSIEDKFDEYLSVVKRAKSIIEAMRKAIVSVIEDSEYKLSVVEGDLRKKVAEYYSEIEKKRRAEEEEKRRAEERLAKERENGEVKIETILEAAKPIQEPPKVSGVSKRIDWKYKASEEPLDPAYTTKDELGFVIPDHKLIRQTVQRLKGDTKIKGVYVYSEVVTIVR